MIESFQNVYHDVCKRIHTKFEVGKGSDKIATAEIYVNVNFILHELNIMITIDNI